MPRTRIKICGIMRPGDARLASDAGADAIGMIFHPPSRRNISLELAREIVGVIGPFVTPVGVFVNASTSTILEAACAVRLRAVQLHGQETASQIAEIAAQGLAIIKSIRVDGNFEQKLARWRGVAGVSGLVLETAAPVPGGSGIANDWDAIRRCQDRGLFDGLPPIIAAGGLSPETVGPVVKLLRPWAVDVSSGVEATFGEKSPEKVAAFIRAAAE